MGLHSTKFNVSHCLFKTLFSDFLQVHKKLFGMLGNPNGSRNHLIMLPGIEVLHPGFLYNYGSVVSHFLGT